MTVSDMFSSIGLSYGFSLPVILLVLFALVALIGAVRPGSNPHIINKLTYCYSALSFGVLLMAAGTLPAVHSVLDGNLLPVGTYIGLIVVLSTGAALFFSFEQVLEQIDGASKQIIGSMFFYAWKFTGLLVSVLSLLALVASAYGGPEAGMEQLAPHITMLLFGLVILWFTHTVPSSLVAPASAAKNAGAPAVSRRSPASAARKGVAKKK